MEIRSVVDVRVALLCFIARIRRLWPFLSFVKLTEHKRCHSLKQPVLICWKFEAINCIVVTQVQAIILRSLWHKHRPYGFIFRLENQNANYSDKFAVIHSFKRQFRHRISWHFQTRHQPTKTFRVD